MSEHVSCFDKQALGALPSELQSRNRITFGSTLYEAFLMCLQPGVFKRAAFTLNAALLKDARFARCLAFRASE